MTKAQKQQWTERAVGAAVAFLVLAVVWKAHPITRLLADSDIPAAPGAFAGADLFASVLAALLTFLGWIGKQVLAWLQGAKAKRAVRKAAASELADLGPAIDGMTAALVTHLQAGDGRAATHAFKSLAALVWPKGKAWPFSGSGEPAKDEAASDAAPAAAAPRKR